MRSLMPHNERERRRKQKEQLPLADDVRQRGRRADAHARRALRLLGSGSAAVGLVDISRRQLHVCPGVRPAGYEIRRYTKLTKGGNSRPGQLALGQGVGYWLLDYGEPCPVRNGRRRRGRARACSLRDGAGYAAGDRGALAAALQA